MEKWRLNCKCETSTLQLVSLSLSLIKDYNSVWNTKSIFGVQPSIFNHINLYINKCQEFYIIIK